MDISCSPDDFKIQHINIDEETVVIPLCVKGSDVVLLQVLFELYEGLGAVRTVNIQQSLICIITTPSMVSHCSEMLLAIRDKVEWRPVDSIDIELVTSIFDFNPKRKR